jgi:hypothetical protein
LRQWKNENKSNPKLDVRKLLIKGKKLMKLRLRKQYKGLMEPRVGSLK